MEKNLRESDRVIMICTDNYVDKANSGRGGVGYEKMIITSDLLKHIDSSKVIPLIRQTGTQNVPTFLMTKLYIDFSRADNYEFAFDELIRTIHGSPLYVKPEIGNNPFQSVADREPEKAADPVKELMGWIVRDFENGADYTIYKNLVRQWNISRIMMDLLIGEAESRELISTDQDGDLHLTAKGKHYAIEHRLIGT